MQKQKRFIPIINLTSILTILLISTIFILLTSCVNNNPPYDYGYYYVERIDSIFFVDYNSIFLLNNRKEKIWLLTEKLLNKDTIYNYIEKYQKLKERSVFKLDLIKIDTLKCIKSTFIQHRSGKLGYDIDDNTIAWSDDTIRYNVYFSPQLLDVYIVKQE